MKSLSVFLSIAATLVLTASSDAFFQHRWFLHSHHGPIHGPQRLIMPAAVAPNFLAPRVSGPTEAAIAVPREVADSISRTTKNLQNARDDLAGLIKKYDLEKIDNTAQTDRRNLPPQKKFDNVQNLIDFLKKN